MLSLVLENADETEDHARGLVKAEYFMVTAKVEGEEWTRKNKSGVSKEIGGGN